jgi:shikimate kinase
MAAGKTTVARALAARLGWRAEDVDELIEARERRPVADIFARQGELYFRSLEREILRLLLPIRHAVVATGGGTFMDLENRAAINLDGFSVWLDVPFETVVARLPADGRRPLAADRGQMERLFVARQTAYAQAHLRLETGLAPAEEIAERILERIPSA